MAEKIPVHDEQVPSPEPDGVGRHLPAARRGAAMMDYVILAVLTMAAALVILSLCGKSFPDLWNAVATRKTQHKQAKPVTELAPPVQTLDLPKAK